MKRVVVVDYDETWPGAFGQLRTLVWPAVRDFAVTLEHVGSTAVPGLAAKPVIDLCLVVPSTSDVPLGTERLTDLGYIHRGDLGVPEREAFAQPAGLPRHHLYLCPAKSLSLKNHVSVRDYLRGDPECARAYGALKQRLAREFPDDIDSYIAGKTSFILGILRDVGLTEEELTAIEKINRMENVARPN